MARPRWEDATLFYTIRKPDGSYLLKDGTFGYGEQVRTYKTPESCRRAYLKFRDFEELRALGCWVCKEEYSHRACEPLYV
jgi:hypothetical protein